MDSPPPPPEPTIMGFLEALSTNFHLDYATIIVFIMIIFSVQISFEGIMKYLARKKYLEMLNCGFDETLHPFTPSELLGKGTWKIVKGRIGMFMAKPEDDVNYLDFDMMDMISKRILNIFPNGLEEFSSTAEDSKVMAVSISMRNFKVGSRCQEFIPRSNGVPNSHFSYQRLSPNVQLTFYNEKDTKFLAGICFYPSDFDKSFMSNQEALIALAQLSAEPYPLQSREKRFEKQKGYKRYGRYCRRVEKRVTVDCSDDWMKIRHLNFNHETGRFEDEECYDCFKDGMKNNFKGAGGDQTTAIASLPIPKILYHTDQWKTIQNEQNQSVVGMAFARNHAKLVELLSLDVIAHNLRKQFENSPKVAEQLIVDRHKISRSTIAISFAEPNFEVGKHYSDFKPIKSMKVSKDAFYTHKKLSETLQATYLNDDNVEYLAGLCYFPVPNNQEMNLKLDEAQIHLTQMAAEPFPKQDRMKSQKFLKFKRYGRMCRGTRVCVDYSLGIPFHVEFDEDEHIYKMVGCRDCEMDAAEYYCEEKAKKARYPKVSNSKRQVYPQLEIFNWPAYLQQEAIAEKAIKDLAKMGPEKEPEPKPVLKKAKTPLEEAMRLHKKAREVNTQLREVQEVLRQHKRAREPSEESQTTSDTVSEPERQSEPENPAIEENVEVNLHIHKKPSILDDPGMLQELVPKYLELKVDTSFETSSETPTLFNRQTRDSLESSPVGSPIPTTSSDSEFETFERAGTDEEEYELVNNSE